MKKSRPTPELCRCPWAKTEQYIEYHDREWGVPVHDDRLLFEFLILEGAQAGLSWQTILNKRENYREAFDHFDPAKVAKYGTRKRQSLLSNPGIVRNRLKIDAAIQNANVFLAVQKEFGTFDKYIWGFVGYRPKQNTWKSLAQVPARTPESDAMSRDLKRRGFSFIGSTICYAFMQAVGMVNDHLVECFRHGKARQRVKRKTATKEVTVKKLLNGRETDKTWFVYLLRCADGSLYTGITNDLPRRLERHNSGTASRYTRCRLPAILVYQEPQASHSHALKRELAIKALSRQEKETMIRATD
jgi:DNA-3-methyladenine glycosylase I